MAASDPNDIDQRLRALVEIAASQSASIAKLEQTIERTTEEHGKQLRSVMEAMMVFTEQIAREGEQITAVRNSLQALERTVMEHGRQIDQQIDAIFRLAKGGDDHERRITRLEVRFPDHGDDFDK